MDVLVIVVVLIVITGIVIMFSIIINSITTIPSNVSRDVLRMYRFCVVKSTAAGRLLARTTSRYFKIQQESILRYLSLRRQIRYAPKRELNSNRLFLEGYWNTHKWFSLCLEEHGDDA